MRTPACGARAQGRERRELRETISRFDVRALPYDGLWAGMLLSEATPERSADHVAAMKRFTDDSERFPDSSYVVLWNYEPSQFKDVIITTFLANTQGGRESAGTEAAM
ncbi:hypothetical protein PG993_006295 [Apiospora rasikravindrae]|uniref:Uncharacterized protein n=1 Tax=Apiospora rasikravindrae TaxID=990691 RepID=A0ABR1T5B3_9PEZI